MGLSGATHFLINASTHLLIHDINDLNDPNDLNRLNDPNDLNRPSSRIHAFTLLRVYAFNDLNDPNDLNGLNDLNGMRQPLSNFCSLNELFEDLLRPLNIFLVDE